MSIFMTASDLTDRSYSTYLARVQTAKRLRTRGHVWNTVLISMATSTTVAGTGILADPQMFGTTSQFAFTSVSILTLSASLVTTGRNYEGRSRDIFENYRKIQRVSIQAELLMYGTAKNEESVIELANHYQDLLDESENHSLADYAATKKDKSNWDRYANFSQDVATYAPLITLIIPAYILKVAFSWVFQS